MDRKMTPQEAYELLNIQYSIGATMPWNEVGEDFQQRWAKAVDRSLAYIDSGESKAAPDNQWRASVIGEIFHEEFNEPPWGNKKEPSMVSKMIGCYRGIILLNAVM